MNGPHAVHAPHTARSGRRRSRLLAFLAGLGLAGCASAQPIRLSETGLGLWTARDFKATIRTGMRMGRGREPLPPMPIPVYNNFTDAELEAVFAYLQTLPAVKNRVPQPRPPVATAAAASAPVPGR
jgi:hypothetical protein